MQDELENLCFVEETGVMAVFFSHDAETVVCIDLFSWTSSLFVLKQDRRGNNLPILGHGKQDGAISSPCSNSFVSYSHFSKRCNSKSF